MLRVPTTLVGDAGGVEFEQPESDMAPAWVAGERYRSGGCRLRGSEYVL